MPSCPPTWPTGLLGHLVGPTGRVVELVPGLAEEAALRLERSGMPWATVEVAAPGVLGRPEVGGSDRFVPLRGNR